MGGTSGETRTQMPQKQPCSRDALLLQGQSDRE